MDNADARIILLKFNLITKQRVARIKYLTTSLKTFTLQYIAMGWKLAKTACGGQSPSLYQVGSGQARLTI